MSYSLGNLNLPRMIRIIWLVLIFASSNSLDARLMPIRNFDGFGIVRSLHCVSNDIIYALVGKFPVEEHRNW